MQVKACQHGLRIREIPVLYGKRIAGKSKVSGDSGRQYAPDSASWRYCFERDFPEGRGRTKQVPDVYLHRPDTTLKENPLDAEPNPGHHDARLEFMLGPNDAVISEAGELSWMRQSIQMTTHTQMAGGGGFFGVFKRVVGGGSLFMTEYRAVGARRSRVRGQGSRAHCAGGSRSRTRIYGAPPWLSVRDTAVQLTWAFSSRWARASSGRRLPSAAHRVRAWRGWSSLVN